MAATGWELEKTLRELVEPVVKDSFLELFDLTVKRQGRQTLVEVTLDKRDGNVTLEDCAQVSRDLEKRLDELDPIEGTYLLEVSSPGLDRPLRGPEDCQRFTGRLALFIVKEPLDGNYSLRGRLTGGSDEGAHLRLEGGRDVTVPFSNVKSARLVVEMKS